MNNLVYRTLLTVSLIAVSFHVQSEGNVQNGETIAKAECAACHGPDGNSPIATFPKIAGIGEKYLLKQLHDIQNAGPNNDPKELSRAIPEMAGILDNKSEQDLADLAAYYGAQPLQLTGAKALDVKVNSGQMVNSLELGARIYRAGNLDTGVPACTGCHSPKGLGNNPAGYPRLGGQYAEYIEKQLRAFRAGERVNDGQTMMMRDIAGKMTDAEIISVANFISGLN